MQQPPVPSDAVRDSPHGSVVNPLAEKVIDELKIELIAVDSAVKSRIRELVVKHLPAFATSDFDMGTTTLICHHINTGDSPPIKQRARREPIKYRDSIEAEMKKLLETGMIRPS